MFSSDGDGSRRKIKGLVVDRQKQFRLAVSCASLILLPSLIINVTLMSDLALENMRLAQAGMNSHDIAERLVALAIRYSLVSIGTFILLATISIYASIKMSNSIVGPVNRLETFINQLAQGHYQGRSNLRKGDYLKPLGEALDRLAERLSSSRPNE